MGLAVAGAVAVAAVVGGVGFAVVSVVAAAAVAGGRELAAGVVCASGTVFDTVLGCGSVSF